jgi:hypothetical protein
LNKVRRALHIRKADMLKRHSHWRASFPFLCLALVFGLRLTAQAQLGIAPIRPDLLGEVITCHIGGSSEVLKPNKRLIRRLSFAPDNVETQKLFDKVSPYTDLRINIYTVPVTNPINVQICPGGEGGRNYIAYSPDWLQRVYDETRNKWALYAIIAHEIGHYVLSHDRTSVGSNREVELEADEYAGKILANMRASLADAQAAYRSKIMADLESHTHPPIADRLTAVERGWKRIRVGRPVAVVSPVATYEGPVELANRVYKGGPDKQFEFRFKISPVHGNTDEALHKKARTLTDNSGTHVWDNKTYYWRKGNNETLNLLLAYKNLTTGAYGWVVVQSNKSGVFFKTVGSKGQWKSIKQGTERVEVRWDSSGQIIKIFLSYPDSPDGRTAGDIKYSFGYSD